MSKGAYTVNSQAWEDSAQIPSLSGPSQIFQPLQITYVLKGKKTKFFMIFARA